MRQFPENRRKLKELILYISRECASHPDYGSTHLNKILFFADFLAYAKFGEPITGAEYMKERRGPVPRAVRLGYKSPISELRREGALRLKVTQLPRGQRVTPIAEREPDTSLFTKEELELTKLVIDGFEGWTAGKISKHTHEFSNWHAANLHETIPYETVFISPDQRLTESRIKRGQELARQRGWLLSEK
jgi:hypothetical protein